MLSDDIQAAVQVMIVEGNKKVIAWIEDEIRSHKFSIIGENRYKFVTTKQSYDPSALSEYFLSQGLLLEFAESYSDSFSTFILSVLDHKE